MDKHIPRYAWRPTWPNEHLHHFSGWYCGRKFSMIHRHQVSGWIWYMNFQLLWTDATVIAPLSGFTDTPRQAACAAEACFDRVIAGTWPGMIEVDIAKAREWATVFQAWRLNTRDGACRSTDAQIPR